MSSDFGLDLAEINRVIDTADVLIIRFQLVDQRLLVDTRSTELDPPLLKLVARASSVEERFRSLKLLRPRLPLPDRILSFQWPRHVTMLAETGVWERLTRRMAATGHPGLDKLCAEVWQDLVLAERREVQAAIVGGPGYQTLWQRSA